MRNVLMLTTLLVSSQANAWLEPFSPYGMMPYGGIYGGYGYGMGGYMPFIPGPSFSYNTTIIQNTPPIIVQQPPQQVIYKEVEVCNSECERLRGYFGKR